MSTAVATEQAAEHSQRAYARIAGLMYFVVLGFDVAGVVIASSIGGNGTFVETSHRIMVSQTLYRIGLCCSLIGSLSTILLAVGLYVALKPVNGNLALTALLFRTAEAAIGGVVIMIGLAVLQIHLAATHTNAFSADQLGVLADLSSVVGSQVSAIFFSLGSSIFFYVFLKSHYIPQVLSAWGLFASLVYAAVWFISLILPKESATAATYGSVPILIAELSAGLWLLIRGIKLQPRNQSDPVGYSHP